MQKADYLVVFIFCVATVLIFLELSIAVLIRHFVTSVEAALELGDPTATTTGFLLKALLLFESATTDDEASTAATSSPYSAISSTMVSSAASPPLQTPPASPSTPLLSHRPLPLEPPQIPSQAIRRKSRKSLYRTMPPSPTRRDITSHQVTVDMNGSPYAVGAAYPVTPPIPPHEGSGNEYPGPRGNRSPSIYDQPLRRMSRS